MGRDSDGGVVLPFTKGCQVICINGESSESLCYIRYKGSKNTHSYCMQISDRDDKRNQIKKLHNFTIIFDVFMCKRVICEHKVFSCWASSVKETYLRFWFSYEPVTVAGPHFDIYERFLVLIEILYKIAAHIHNFLFRILYLLFTYHSRD